MGCAVVRQPNGLYARFTTTVDDFTDYNLTAAEVIALYVKSGYRQQGAEQKLMRGKYDEPASFEVKDSGRHDWLDRYRAALLTIYRRHGRTSALAWHRVMRRPVEQVEGKA